MHARWALALLIPLALLGAGCTDGADTPSSAAEEEAHESSVDPATTVARIETLLDDLVVAYSEGDAEAAGELAAEAYLENYEHIEHDVEEADEELNEELETLLGADLRRQIDAGVAPDEIETMVAHAKELLAEALTAVSGE